MRQSESLERVTSAPELVVGDIWWGVPGASSYFVSSDGRVLSVVKKRPRLLRPGRSGLYRALAVVHDDGTRRTRYLHHLVLEAVHGPAPEGHEARHLDGNRDNNACTNLKWGTRRENHADKIRHGTSARGVRNPQAKLTPDDVRRMRVMYASGDWTFKRLAAEFGVSTMTALRAVRRESWSHV